MLQFFLSPFFTAVAFFSFPRYPSYIANHTWEERHAHCERLLPGNLWLQGLQTLPGRGIHLPQPGRHSWHGRLRLLLRLRKRRICPKCLRRYPSAAGACQKAGRSQVQNRKIHCLFSVLYRNLRPSFQAGSAVYRGYGAGVHRRPVCRHPPGLPAGGGHCPFGPAFLAKARKH